ncbi:Outer membrane protein assembly factor YaeT precursor [Candidatus Karelsulcia muelleri]|uniref:Outer membrane protein assembly factor YaeT n=1 Tax=Candidatus Karelsulcia muelleri TaxID=336810 RepID=A0A654M5P9_9FLAO|nr:POTRA domain-containing protein [Candidatus Karelsulcia muelleri]ALP70137.1 Outer membrane protein assembly factor YaeT precursor [Candidatus Karelsulcia muelleri]
MIKLFKNIIITIIFCVLFFNTKIYCKDNNEKDFNIKDIELIELIEKVYEKPSQDKEISFENTETEANVNREKDNKTDFKNISEKKIGETYFNKIDGEKAKKTYKNKTDPKKENKTPRPRPRSRPDVEADAEAEVKAYKPKIDFNKFYKRINKKMIDDIYYSDKDKKEKKTEIEFDKKIIDKIEKKYNIDSIYNHENGIKKIDGIEIDKNGIKIEKNDGIDENGRNIDRIEIEKAEEEEKVVIEKQVDKDKKIELLPLIDYKIGDKLNIKNNKFNEIKRKLLNTGHFSNVSIKIKSLNDKDIILQIFFTIKDRFDIIKILGIKEKDRNQIYNIIGLNLSHNTRFNDDFKKKIVKLIQGYYENNGYLDVTFNFEQTKDSSKKNLLLITVNQGRIMKLTKFLFEGNYSFTEKKLKKVLNNYKYYEIIKKKIIDFYLTNGFKDVEITSFSLEKENNNNYLLKIKINEGKKYRLGNISYQGNNSFNDEYFRKLIGLKKGDVYNTLLLNKNILDNTNPNSIISLYLNNGYAFSTISFSEEKKENNSIDIKLIISEGAKVILNKVNIIGNNKIKDKIILRELTTMPGDFFSKKEIEKTLKNLNKLDLFEKIFLNIKKNEKEKLIDLNFIVLEKKTSKLQFKIDTNFIGIISLNVNNFSLLNSFNPKNWNPIPYGDNQKIIFNLEIGKKIICYNISFLDPLIFDSLKLNFSSSKEKKNDDLLDNKSSYLEIEKLLSENNKILFNINYRKTNFLESKKQIYKDLNYSISINHNSVSPNNCFPKKGQIINFKTQFTLPYSLINTTYKNKLLEYFKVQFEYLYYKELLNRLTTKIGYEFGILHSKGKGVIEKSFLPGYYEPYHKNGGLIYEKFITELNYLIFDQVFAKCWLTNFFEAGNIYDKYKDFSFFNLKRSLGTGIKLYLNNIGFLGCDIAYRKTIDNPGWKMDFFFKKEF